MPLFDDLAGAYGWLNAQVNYERQLGRLPSLDQAFELEGFRRRLAPLGDPQRGLRTLHIAGTRGKGSAALALEALLRAAGLRTAVYTSPHLREYRERIRLDGEPISGELFTRLLRRIAEASPATEPAENAGRPFKTVFENLTALFFLAARESGADWAIVETGLGGRLDATNVLEPGPVLLTRIGLEHTHLLGDTLTKIAGEKAAILKPGGWAVAAAQAEGGEAEAVFRARAAATDARLAWAPELCPIRRLEPHAQGLRLELEFMGRPLPLELGLYGTWQAENIQNALAMLTRLAEERLVAPLAAQQVAAALARLRIPGRMEKVCASPEVFADGGHCPTAAAALARTMRGHFGEEPAGLLVGMMEEKDHDGFFRELARWNHWAWVGLYQVDSPRAATPETLARAARRHFHNIFLYKNLEQALQSLPSHDEKVSRIVACGSLYSIAHLQDWGLDYGRHSTQRPSQAEQIADHRHPGA
jgi:dihydrofolate synthase/folylpolyglutamate synthase